MSAAVGVENGSQVAPRPVTVSRLSRRFGAVRALDDLSFQAEPGELLGIVGPDGAGKTTLMRILAGVLRPSDGDARILGRSLAADPESVKPHLAYMAQRFGLYEDLTVLENLVFYADLYGVPRHVRPARLERLFRFSGLEPFQGLLAGALSGGMKQKLSLSCCLVHHPRVLLLDEPTFGVDPISRRDLWLIVHEMVADGVTAVVSTSYLDEAERCDRVLFLDRGRSVALDTPAALLASLPGLLLEVTAADPRRVRDVLRGERRVTGVALFGDRLHVLVPDRAVWEGTLGSLRAAGAEVSGAHPLDPSLEDVFIHRIRAEESHRA